MASTHPVHSSGPPAWAPSSTRSPRPISAGWGSTQTIGLTTLALVGLAAFAAWERRTEKPLLRVERLADRAVGGGLFLMIVAAGSLFGLFLLSSLYLQNVLGTSPLMTGLAFLPLALAAGLGAHAAGHIVGHHGVRMPLASAFLITATGMALLAHVSENGTYLRNVLPGMLVAGFGLGIAVVSVSIAILTGSREDESGMISGLNSTGHEIGGTIGIAIFSTIAAGATGALGGAHAASSIAHAFMAAGVLTTSRKPGRTRGPPPRPRLRAQAPPQPKRDAGPLRWQRQTTPAPAPRRRRADADRSVAAILAATLEALASDPDASMAEIARRAGVVRATIYVHFPTRESLLDAVMEHAVAEVAQATSDAEPERGEPREALERVLRATWQKLDSFQALLTINTARLSPEELHRRHLPVVSLFAPLIERGQKAGVFRSDLPVSWHLAVIRALAHTASFELQAGRIAEDRGRSGDAHDRARRDQQATIGRASPSLDATRAAGIVCWTRLSYV